MIKKVCFERIQRVSGIRKFSDSELEALRVIECLKKSGLEIRISNNSWNGASKEVRLLKYAGNFWETKAAVEEEIAKLNKVLDMIHYKCWYYDEAMKFGNEERLKHLTPEEPEAIKSHYERSH